MRGEYMWALFYNRNWGGTWNKLLPVGTSSELSPSAEFVSAAVTPSHRQNMIPLMGLHRTADSQWLLWQRNIALTSVLQSNCDTEHKGHKF
jgi:hypothetical protein